MRFTCKKSALTGKINVPGSKSHTIRAVFIASLAEGESILRHPLTSSDAESAVHAVEALGVTVDRTDPDAWKIKGFGGLPEPQTDCIDVANSGTTLRILLGFASLLKKADLTLTGDKQIQKRPAGPLITALQNLGADVTSVNNNDCAPLLVRGGLKGGKTTLSAPTSQYLTSLLMACPLAENDTDIKLTLLNEKPYVRMTLDWLDSQRIRYDCSDDMMNVRIFGKQSYKCFDRVIPADFSSATFFLIAGALSSNSVTCNGLDMTDSQADKAVVDYLKKMGANVKISGNSVTVSAEKLIGTEIDMNETPDALPAMAVLGCFAEGETRLVNVAHARIKETDRIAVMYKELKKMGADIEELSDGLIIRKSNLQAADVNGHDDHRIVMSLALAGMQCTGRTIIDTAEAASVTFPTFDTLMKSIGGNIARD